MSILNQNGISSYSRSQPKYAGAGQPAEWDHPKARAFRNPLRQQVNNIAVGTFDTDTDSIAITITEPDGTVHTVSVTRAAGAPADATAAAVALRAAINALVGLKGIVVASGATTNVILTFAHAGIAYSVVATPSAGTTATLTETTGPAGSSIPYGVFVQRGTDVARGQHSAILPDGATAEQIAGVVIRPIFGGPNLSSPLASAEDLVPPGNMMAVAYDGAVVMLNAGLVAATEGDRAWAIVDDAGGAQIGGAAAAAVGVAQASTVVPVVNQGEYGFILVLDGVTYPAHYTPTDATTSVEDAIDGLYDSLVGLLGGATSAANGKGVTITESATELTITTDAGVVIQDLRNSVWSLDTEAPSTVVTSGASGAYAVRLPNCYWAEDTAVGALGKVMLRL